MQETGLRRWRGRQGEGLSGLLPSAFGKRQAHLRGPVRRPLCQAQGQVAGAQQWHATQHGPASEDGFQRRPLAPVQGA